MRPKRDLPKAIYTIRCDLHGGWVTFSKYFSNYFGWKGTISSNPRWSRKTRDIPVSYGVEILTDGYSILSQYTHLTVEWTDGQTEFQQ